MTDTQAIGLVRELVDAATQGTLVANGLRRGTERAAESRERKARRALLTALLGRKASDIEVEQAGL